MNEPARPRPDVNPYAAPAPLEPSTAAEGDPLFLNASAVQPRMTEQPVAARRLGGGFLFRTFELGEPLGGILTYSGWWFVQRVYWNGRLVWRKISWWTLEREITFRFPPQSTAAGLEGKIEIEFGPGLFFRRFTLLCDGILVYEDDCPSTHAPPR